MRPDRNSQLLLAIALLVGVQDWPTIGDPTDPPGAMSKRPGGAV
jgi:hypothetical protein